MATNTTTPFRTLTADWQKLEPAIPEPEPQTIHKRIQANRTYASGQLIGPIAQGANAIHASLGHGAIATARLFPLVYPIATDASGYSTLGDTVLADDPKHESMEVYYQGCFFARDLVGLTEANLPRVGQLIQGTVSTDASNTFSNDAIVRLG